uniref:MADF domain-containing protein n=1 Tax=Parascaris univalens TaxID=6257 RepID=A0A915A8C2_PARUN
MDLIAAGMESATRKSAPKKRRISERVDWLNREVMAVLRMMDGDKSITLSAGSDLIERITGRRVDNATMCRRLRWLRESANSWEKLSSAQLGEGEADGDKPERDSVDTDIEGLYELLYRPKCRQIDGSRVRQSVDAETAGSCILSTLHNNGHNLTCERMVECGSDPTATTVSATCDASSTRPLWRRILTWHSENGSTESQVPIADASNCTVDEGDRYEQTEGEGFCVKEENGADPSVATAEPTYSIVHTSFPQKTTSTVNCSTDMSDIVPSRQVQNNCVPAAECLENANIDLHMFSEADLMPSEGSSQCCPLPINSDRAIPAISNDTNRRRRIMRNCVSGRVSVRDIRRYNVLSKNAAARRIAAESQQGAYRNNVSIGKAQMRSRRHCTGNNDMNSTGSDDSLSTLIRSPITTKCKTRSVAVGSDRVLSLRDKRMDDALLTIEGLLSKVGTIQRDEFNNLGDSVADCLRGVNRVDAAAAAQFKLELLEMMARYQKATLFK